MTDGGYDIGYRACDCFWGTQPGSLVLKLCAMVSSVKGMKILDAGCGEGKNAIFLASKGAAVRAFDISAVGIAHARKQTSANRVLGLELSVADVRRIELPRAHFDVVIAYGLFHCFQSVEEISETCGKLQAATRPGGCLIACAFNDRNQDLSAHPGFSPTFLAHEEYRRLFSGWELLEFTDTDLIETHPHNGIQHTHSLTRLIARKSPGEGEECQLRIQRPQ